MAKRSVHTIHFTHSPDVVLGVLTDPEFNVANFKAQGNPEAKVTEVSRTDERLVLRADVTEYAKGLTGVDKSKTEPSATTYEWDLSAKSGSWTYKGPHAQARVWGAIRVAPDGGGAVLTEEFNVEVKVPLVGGKIEKMVMKEVDKFWPTYEKLIQDFCDRAAG